MIESCRCKLFFNAGSDRSRYVYCICFCLSGEPVYIIGTSYVCTTGNEDHCKKTRKEK